VDASSRLGLVLERQRDETEREGLLLPEVRSSSSLNKMEIPDLIFLFDFRRLIELMRSSQDSIVLAVAAHDLGQYVKYYEHGKKYGFSSAHINSFHLTFSPSLKPRIVTNLGAKTRAMELMSHSSQEVRYQALLSVQRLVSQPWKAV